MFAVIYRWRLKPGHEDQSVDGWSRVTRAMHAGCGSHGSRLHRAADGTWVAYACWPDASTRERCRHTDVEGEQMMSDAIAEQLDSTKLDVVADLLREAEDPGS